MQWRFRMGTNVNEAKAMMASSGIQLISLDNLDDAARMAAQISAMVGLAKEANLEVAFKI